MDRRTCLRSIGAAGAGLTAGCLETVPGMGSGGDGDTVLDPPEERRGDPSHPIHGEPFPSFELPDPLADDLVSSTQFEGERSILMTFFFTSCPDGACPALLQKLRRAQADAAERGYGDDVAFLAMTFDPDRDTPDAIDEYAGEMNVDLEAGNWHFLRPEDNEAAKSLLDEEFGVPIERVESDEAGDAGSEDNDSDAHGHGDEENGSKGHDHDGEQNDSEGHDHGEYTFTHFNLIFLANDRGIVERAYPGATQEPTETILGDLRTVVEE